jgi:hypothetical protein
MAITSKYDILLEGSTVQQLNDTDPTGTVFFHLEFHYWRFHSSWPNNHNFDANTRSYMDTNSNVHADCDRNVNPIYASSWTNNHNSNTDSNFNSDTNPIIHADCDRNTDSNANTIYPSSWSNNHNSNTDSNFNSDTDPNIHADCDRNTDTFCAANDAPCDRLHRASMPRQRRTRLPEWQLSAGMWLCLRHPHAYPDIHIYSN